MWGGPGGLVSHYRKPPTEFDDLNRYRATGVTKLLRDLLGLDETRVLDASFDEVAVVHR